jgi:Secretion system C-terminal sorting domain
MKKLYFFLLTTLFNYAQVQIGQDIDGEAANDASGWSVSLSSNGDVIAIGAIFNNGKGHVRIYKNVSGVWTQIGSDIDGEATGDLSGSSVSLSSDGSIVAISAYGNKQKGDFTGQVSVYKNVSGVWTQIGSDIYGEAAEDYSGYSVSLSSDGSIVAIGANRNTGSGVYSGHVRVYKNMSGVWTKIGSDIDGETASDVSGHSVSLSSNGTIVAIGAINNAGNGIYSGHVRIYKNMSGVWTQIGADIDGEVSNDNSGHSVSLSSDGSIVAVGAINNAGNGAYSGHVRIYKNVTGEWIQIGSDIDGEASDDNSGYSVSLSSDGSIVAIGARENAGNGAYSGHVRIYKNMSGVWTKIGSDIDGEAAYDLSGGSLSLSSDGTIVAIGAIGNKGNGVQSGHVRVFDLSSVLSSDTFVLSNFSIYPNPATDIVNITLQENLQLDKVNIYNQLGQLVKTEKNTTIATQDLTKGSYYFEVVTDKGKATKAVIVK